MGTKVKKRVSKSTLRNNAKCIKIMFEAVFANKFLDGKSFGIQTDQRTSITDVLCGGELVLSSEGFMAHEVIGTGWFKEVNGEPVYDRDRSMKLAVSLRKSGKLK
jgi:hypothetical protein